MAKIHRCVKVKCYIKKTLLKGGLDDSIGLMSACEPRYFSDGFNSADGDGATV